MLKLKDIKIVESKKELEALPEGKLLINTINAHSYNTALKDVFFAEALMKGDALIPDGASIVMACRKLKAKSQPTERIAGWDLFAMEMERLNQKGGTCFFMGSSEKVLNLIREKRKQSTRTSGLKRTPHPTSRNSRRKRTGQSSKPSTGLIRTCCGLA